MQTNISSKLQAHIEQVRPASDKYNIEYTYAMTFNLSNKDNYLWNAIITVLSANFAQVSATQTECWYKLNCETHPKTKACAKQNGIRWCQQCNKADAIGRNRAWLAQRLWTETNYVKNTTSVSSCNLGQVTLTNYPNQNTYERNNDNIAFRLLHQSWW